MTHDELELFVAKKNDDKPLSFEDALAKLESIVRELEDGQLGLSDSLARYEEGVRYLKHCHQALGAAEKKISLLTGDGVDGPQELQPYDDEVMSLDEKQAARSRRRSQQRSDSNRGSEADVDTQQGLF